MKDAIKSNIFWICMSGIIVGRIASRILTNYFGLDGHNIVGTVAAGIMFSAVIGLFITRQYLWGIVFLIMSLPLVIGLIGMYLDNTHVMGIGILLVFIMYPILIKIIPKLKKDK